MQIVSTDNPWVWPAIVLVGAVLLALAVHWAVFQLVQRVMPTHLAVLRRILIDRVKGPTRIILPLIALFAALPVLPAGGAGRDALDRVTEMGFIALAGWLSLIFLAVLEDVVTLHYRITEGDNLRARQIQTQSQLFRRIAATIIIVCTAGLMLMTFPSIRHLGVSLFASAGVAGIVIGMAARPALSNMIAGFQIALTEPIRLDDVVIVEGEWGRVEEIGTTFVVIRIWDLRRLIVPLSYFIEKPFQNWTRTSADLLGTVFLYTDYTVPVEDVRREHERILKESDLWDEKVSVVQVTDARENTVELRLLMSASNSGSLWDLRCLVREKLIAFIAENYPDSLPRVRAVVPTAGGNHAGVGATPPSVPAVAAVGRPPDPQH